MREKEFLISQRIAHKLKSVEEVNEMCVIDIYRVIFVKSFYIQRGQNMLEQGCFTSHLLSFDNNKVLKIINWIC